MKDVIIIGGGASGLFASVLLKPEAIVIERNERAGEKLLLTGGGKCNFTHLGNAEETCSAYYDKKNFVKRAIYNFPPEKIISFFEKRLHVPSCVSENGKVFPASGKSSTVLSALLDNAGQIIYSEKVVDITKKDGLFIVRTDKNYYTSRYVIVAAGGNSFPKTGSDGSICPILKKLGHTVIPLTPALSRIKTNIDFSAASGITVALAIKGKEGSLKGSAVITPSGFGGPVAENFSRYLRQKEEITIDFLPDEELAINRCAKEVRNVVPLPSSLLSVLIERRILDKKSAELTKEEERKIISSVKNFKISASVDGKSAMSSRGGVKTKEIDSKSMRSRIVENLYFAGEIMDVDAICGGYSLTFAFSSAALACLDIGKRLSQGK